MASCPLSALGHFGGWWAGELKLYSNRTVNCVGRSSSSSWFENNNELNVELFLLQRIPWWRLSFQFPTFKTKSVISSHWVWPPPQKVVLVYFYEFLCRISLMSPKWPRATDLIITQNALIIFQLPSPLHLLNIDLLQSTSTPLHLLLNLHLQSWLRLL